MVSDIFSCIMTWERALSTPDFNSHVCRVVTILFKVILSRLWKDGLFFRGSIFKVLNALGSNIMSFMVIETKIVLKS